MHYGQIVLSVHCPYNTKIKIFQRVQNLRLSDSIFWNENHVGINLFYLRYDSSFHGISYDTSTEPMKCYSNPSSILKCFY